MRSFCVRACVFWIFCTVNGYSQDKKVVTAIRTNCSIQIDGLLDEPGWSASEVASEFVDLKPDPGLTSENQSCVRIIYDDTGIYIGAELDEDAIERLGIELFERDNLSDNRNIDWFGIAIDCYQSGVNGYGFIVSASGVQTDIKFSGNDQDASWDAVWDSDVHAYDHYWTCEIKIPYSALRFPEKVVQQWGIQFGRRSHQRHDESFWNPVDPEKDGFLTQTGVLNGIRDIRPPARFSVTPYFAAYAENYVDPSVSHKKEWGMSYNAGMDIKYGISDAYTLDMTLIPDFGQVQSDNEVLNLSPYEVQFGENRQFFTEGTELFNRAGLFYSRRVGGTPYYYDQVYNNLAVHESVTEIKSDSRLVNATKISGRGNKGTGLAYFNAISSRDYAVIYDSITDTQHEVLLQPWTNYNIIVLDQNLKNNSYFSLINTNVWREGIANDANVTGVDFNIRNRENKYGIEGQCAVNYKSTDGKVEPGFEYNIELGRLSGNLIWEVGHNVLSDTYDPNDLGYRSKNNESSWDGFVAYTIYKPFGPFLNWNVGTSLRYVSLYRFPGAPEDQYRSSLFTGMGVESWMSGLFKNYLQWTIRMYAQPFNGYDYYEPRVEGRFFEYPSFMNMSFYMNSDSRKKWTGWVNMRYLKFHEEDKYQSGYGFYTNYRINNHFSFGYEFQKEFYTLDRGYVTEIEDDIVFGARDYHNLTQVLSTGYTFNPKLTFSFRLRHNWARIQYSHFYTLQYDGSIEDRVYNQNEDINFNAWTIDAGFRWHFAPGSDMFVVWKNSIYANNQQSMISYAENMHQLFDNPQFNSFSVKAIYYIDFQEWK